MKFNKIKVDGKEVEIVTDILDSEIEKNEFIDEDTIDITTIIEEIKNENGN